MAIGIWYRLDENRKPVACENHSEYFEWHRSLPEEFATGIGIQLARTRISDRLSVSTVFLGMDHAYDAGPPELWETMIFGGDRDEETTRYRSWDDAIAGHERIVNELRAVVA